MRYVFVVRKSIDLTGWQCMITAGTSGLRLLILMWLKQRHIWKRVQGSERSTRSFWHLCLRTSTTVLNNPVLMEDQLRAQVADLKRKLQQTQRSNTWCGGNSQSLACRRSFQMWTELLYRVCVRPCVVGYVRPLFTVLVLEEKRRNHSMCALFVTGSSRDMCVGASVLIAIMACIIWQSLGAIVIACDPRELLIVYYLIERSSSVVYPACWQEWEFLALGCTQTF